MRTIGLFSILFLAFGCTGETTGGGGTEDCPAGQIVVGGECTVLCSADRDCDNGCCGADGVCTTCVGQPPIINSVDGTGSPDGAVGHASQHLRDRLVINGENLLDAEFSLVSGGGMVHDLSPCAPATDTRVEVSLPLTITEGDYVLSAANQAGSCDASLSLLQGEAGTLNASAFELVSSINTYSTANPGQGIVGTLAGETSTLAARASATTLTSRSILINGIDEVDDNTSNSLFLVVFDVTTHAVHDVSIGAVLTTRQAFAADDALGRQGVIDVLASLGEDHVIILASAGDITAMTADAAVATALKAVGASQRFEALAADEAYILIGQVGLGEGSGLERVVGAERSNMAEMATAVVDRAVVGMVNGDVTGASIVDGSIASADLTDNSVASGDILDGTIVGADIGLPFTIGALTATSAGVGVGVTDPGAYVLNVNGNAYVLGDGAFSGNISFGDATLKSVTGASPGCGAGFTPFLTLWSARTCTAGCATNCTTAAGWGGNAPTCIYNDGSSTCVANAWTRAICINN